MMWHDIARECVRSIKNPVGVMIPSLFYMIILIMFMFLDAPDTERWAQLLPHLILVPAFLAMWMIPSQLFADDYQSGYLQYYVINHSVRFRLIFMRLLTVGCVNLAPLLLISLGFACMMGLSSSLIQAMGLSLVLSLPTLFLMAAMAGALTLALPQAPLLQALILMPLYIPVLLFAQSMIMRATMHLDYTGFIYLLLALLLLAVAGLPLVTTLLLTWAYE